MSAERALIATVRAAAMAHADVQALIGARFYDGGEPDEGAAFLFLGSAGGIGFTNVEYEMTEQDALTSFADELLHEAIRDELAVRCTRYGARGGGADRDGVRDRALPGVAGFLA